MEFKTTSIKSRRDRATGAATLLELMIAIPIGMIALGMIISFSIYTARSFAGLLNYTEMESSNRVALDTMSEQIRQATSLTGFTTNSLTFSDANGQSLLFTFNPTNRTVVRTQGTTNTTLLRECDSMTFSIYQRCTTNGTFDQYPTSLQASNTKVIQMSWNCSRYIAGSKLNTETMQMAKIVMRKQ